MRQRSYRLLSQRNDFVQKESNVHNFWLLLESAPRPGYIDGRKWWRATGFKLR